MASMRQHLEEELSKDYKELKQLEDRLRYEEDPRFRGKWESGIRDTKQRISDRQKELEFLDEKHLFVPSTHNDTQHKLNSRKIERLKENIKLAEKEYEGISRKINVIIGGIDDVIDVSEKDILKQRKLKLEKERDLVVKKMEELEEKLARLSQ